MKKLIDLSIYPAFVIASVLVANVLSPPVMEISHAPVDQIDVANRSKIIVTRGGSTITAFDDFAPAQIATPTQTIAPRPTSTTKPTPRDTAMPMPAPTDTLTPMPTSTGTRTLIPMPTPTGTRTQTIMLTPTGTGTWTLTPEPTTRATSMPGLTSTTTPTSAATPTKTPTATVTWVTWIATVTKIATPTPTSTPAKILPMRPSSLLARLADKKPSIWGSKSFYILLGLAYITLLGLFLKQVISTLRHN